MNEQKHYCIYCGKDATYQFKNGNWCCTETKSSCPAIRKKNSNKAQQKWNQLKQKGIKYRKDIPLQQRNKDVGQQHICFYCGSYAEYQLKNEKWCCKPYPTQCPSNKKKNSQKIKSLYSKNKDGQCVFNGKLRKDQYTEQSRKKQCWNKGLTKYTNQSLRKKGLTYHQKILQGKIIPYQLGKAHTDQWKDKMMNTKNNNSITTVDNSIGYKRGWYKGYWCDSSWELAYIMYNLDHGIFLQRNLKGFPYKFECKNGRYYPDFILEDGTYVEIKGFHSQLTDQKIKSFPKNLTIKILYEQDMRSYLEYAKNKYGKDYWKLLKKEKY